MQNINYMGEGTQVLGGKDGIVIRSTSLVSRQAAPWTARTIPTKSSLRDSPSSRTETATTSR